MVQEEQERLILLLLQQAIVLSRTSKINDFSLLALLFKKEQPAVVLTRGFSSMAAEVLLVKKRTQGERLGAENEWTAAPPRSKGPLTATTGSSARHRPHLPLLAQVKDRVWRGGGGRSLR